LFYARNIAAAGLAAWLLCACATLDEDAAWVRARFGATAGVADLEGALGFQIGQSGVVNPVGGSTLGDLGLEDGDTAPGFEVEVDLGSPRLILSSVLTGSSGSGILTDQFELLDDQNGFGTEFVRFEPGTELASTLDLAVHRAVLMFGVVETETFDAALGFGLEAVDIEGTFRGQAALYDPGGQVGPEQLRSARIDSLLPLPVVAASVSKDLGSFRLEGDLRWIEATSGSKDASVLGFGVAARFGPWRYFDAVLGYRSSRMDISYQSGGQSAVVDVEVTGPYVGFGLSF
jgi:hypothetical protein